MSEFDLTRVDHLNLAVGDMERSRAFYTPTLAAIGIDELTVVQPGERGNPGGWVGYGNGDKPFLWLRDDGAVGERTHLAFSVGSREGVHAFYDAALAAGGKDNGAPGTRPEYHDGYYGAFVLDPDGINVEAVFHGPAT